MQRRHEQFEWDPTKAARNLRKHGIGFDLAAYMLADEQADRFHVTDHDARHSGDEVRWITLGSVPGHRSVVLFVVWTERQDVTRIISARKANRTERADYEERTETF